MEEGEAAAAGEQKKKTFPFSRSSRAKPFLGVSIAVSRVSLESSLSREGGMRRKTACRWQAPSPHSKRMHGIILFFSSANDESLLSLFSFTSQQTPQQPQQRLQRQKQRSSFADTCSTRCGPRGEPTRRLTLSEFFGFVFFWQRRRRLRQTTFHVECRVPRSLFASALKFCSLGQSKDVS